MRRKNGSFHIKTRDFQSLTPYFQIKKKHRHVLLRNQGSDLPIFQ
jgi:hypothetical protein